MDTASWRENVSTKHWLMVVHRRYDGSCCSNQQTANEYDFLSRLNHNEALPVGFTRQRCYPLPAHLPVQL